MVAHRVGVRRVAERLVGGGEEGRRDGDRLAVGRGGEREGGVDPLGSGEADAFVLVGMKG